MSSATLLALNQLPGGVPRGYLRVLSFNEDSVLVDQRTVQLRATALGNYDTLQTGPLLVQQNGYVSVYVGNESAADVYFDDVTVEHRQGLQVQENQYDPFGLDLAGVSGAAPGMRLKNFYQFNGKENQLDLGLNWNHQDTRFFDYQIGRWHVVDPEVENGQETWGPYAFGFDNAIRYNDPDGECPLCVRALVGAATEYATEVFTNVIEHGGINKDIYGEILTGGNVSLGKIALAGVAGAAGVGIASTISKVGTLGKLASLSGKSAKLVKIGSDIAGDVASSVAGNKLQGNEVTLAGTLADVAGDVAGRKAEAFVKAAAQKTPAAKLLQKQARKLETAAARRGRASSIDKAQKAAKEAAEFGTGKATVAGAVGSTVGSKVVGAATSKDDKPK